MAHMVFEQTTRARLDGPIYIFVGQQGASSAQHVVHTCAIKSLNRAPILPIRRQMIMLHGVRLAVRDDLMHSSFGCTIRVSPVSDVFVCSLDQTRFQCFTMYCLGN